MSLPGRILLGTVIGVTVLIAGCGNDSHNTSLTANQRTTVATATANNAFVNLGRSFGTGVAISPALAGPTTVQANCSAGAGGSQNCTIPSTTLDCLLAGTFTISGPFKQTTDTATNLTTVDLTNITMVPHQCTADNDLLITGSPNLIVKGTGLQVDETGTPPDIRLPFTVTAKGHISFTKGPANTDPTFPSSGECDVNVTATFQQVPDTTPPPLQVQAAVTGTVCGSSFNEPVEIGSF